MYIGGRIYISEVRYVYRSLICISESDMYIGGWICISDL